MAIKSFTLARFKVRVLIYIGLITLTLIGISYCVISAQSIFTVGFLVGVLTYWLYRLFTAVNKTNRDLTNFLLSIRFDDFESSYTQTNAESIDKANLNAAFNLITDKFRDIRSDKEAQHQFLRALVEQVETGLICFDQDGQTILMNRALQKILHKSYVPHLESLMKVDETLYQTIKDYSLGVRQLIKIDVENDILQLAVMGTELRMSDHSVRLFSFHNINSELNQQEIDAWHKLIRILTHEIMNSVSPVVSLASTTEDIILKATSLDEATKNNIHQAVHAIQKRSESLLLFTRKFRELLRLPKPELENCDLKELLNDLVVLYKPLLDEKNIAFKTQFPAHLVHIQADAGLLEQAFINLLKNAVEALEGQQEPVLEMTLFKDHDDTIVQIADNGPGIKAEEQSNIFTPFYTTKKSGSGIGLSLCRQIIIQHGGSITVQSALDRGTIFTIRL